MARRIHTTLEGNFSDLVAGPGGDRIPQHLPHVHMDFVRRPVGLPWLSLGWRSEATHFMNETGDRRWREQLFPQGTVVFRPIQGVSLTGMVGVREILSQFEDESWGGEGDAHRTLLETGAQAEASMGRGFAWGGYRLPYDGLLSSRSTYAELTRSASSISSLSINFPAISLPCAADSSSPSTTSSSRNSPKPSTSSR